MARSIMHALVIAFTVVAMAAVASHATEQNISGTVEQVNRQQGTITITPEGGALIQVQVPEAVLSHLQEGDVVEVRLAEGRIIELHQKRPERQPAHPVPPRQPDMTPQVRR